MLHHCGMPLNDVDLIHGNGKVVGDILKKAEVRSTLFTGSAKVAEILAQELKGKVLNPCCLQFAFLCSLSLRSWQDSFCWFCCCSLVLVVALLSGRGSSVASFMARYSTAACSCVPAVCVVSCMAARRVLSCCLFCLSWFLCCFLHYKIAFSWFCCSFHGKVVNPCCLFFVFLVSLLLLPRQDPCLSSWKKMPQC